MALPNEVPIVDPVTALIDTLDTALALRRQLDALASGHVHVDSMYLVTLDAKHGDAEHTFLLWASAHELCVDDRTHNLSTGPTRCLVARTADHRGVASLVFDSVVEEVAPPHATDDQNRTDVDSQQLWVPQ